jgi:hypothetical protein
MTEPREREVSCDAFAALTNKADIQSTPANLVAIQYALMDENIRLKFVEIRYLVGVN